jgi:CRISPR-associated protein Csm4
MIFKITLKPRSAMGTPFRSDTLFGHACWTVLHHEGENRFSEFHASAVEQKPELVFSDGFPEGWLPRPLLPKKLSTFTDSKVRAEHKKAAKRKWVNRQVAEGCGWNLELLDKQAMSVSADYSDSPLAEVQSRNVIDRLTGTSLEEHGLYSYERHWYTGIWKNVSIYISTVWSKETLFAFLKKMFEIGYGRDQTIGLGAIEIGGEPQLASFPQSDGRGYYLSLSHCIPDGSILLKESFFQTNPKYGKVWSGLEHPNPFKKVILQVVPGSVLKTTKESAECAGRVLAGVHDHADIIENCMTVLYPLPDTVISGATP